MPRTSRRRVGGRAALAVLAAAGLTVTGVLAASPTTAAAKPAASTQPPPVRHVFVVNLENKGYDETFGPDSPAPYLSKTLTAKGQLLTQYYGTAHNSLPNYVAQISGQGPNPQTQGDCQVYSDFVADRDRRAAAGRRQRVRLPRGREDRRRPARGEGPDLARLHGGHGHAVPAPRRQRGRRHPEGEGRRPVRRPAQPVRVLPQHHRLARPARPTTSTSRSSPTDLSTVATTRNLTYITPNLCNDAHDSPCVDGRPGGLVTADEWLSTWIPKILASPAYKKDGLLVVTFDEADTESTDGADACCGEGPGPNSPLPGIYGTGRRPHRHRAGLARSSSPAR